MYGWKGWRGRDRKRGKEERDRQIETEETNKEERDRQTETHTEKDGQTDRERKSERQTDRLRNKTSRVSLPTVVTRRAWVCRPVQAKAHYASVSAS